MPDVSYMEFTGKDAAIEIFNEAVKAVQPAVLIPGHIRLEVGVLNIDGQVLPLHNYDGVYVLAVGKAAAAMALEAEKVLGDTITTGLVVTKYQHSLPLQYCRAIEAGHPVPDENSLAAALAVVDFCKPLTSNSLLLCFISGGASALLADVAEGISLADMQSVSRLMLQCGANIQEMNTVRKHLSYLKGGQLLRHLNGATVFSFIISDVQGDDLSVIASGLTVANTATYADAWQVLVKYALVDEVPPAIKSRLLNGMQQGFTETGKPALGTVQNILVANNAKALHAAEQRAKRLGFATAILNGQLQGEAKNAASRFWELLWQYNGPRPACLLAGGETTVTVTGNGKGGRNQEFVLAVICQLIDMNVPAEKWPVLLSAGTDGTDGPTEAAGAIVNIYDYYNIKKMGLNPHFFIKNNDAFRFFEAISGLIVTGATQTNVMDVVVAIIS
jgi:glycerate 2-kinase